MCQGLARSNSLLMEAGQQIFQDGLDDDRPRPRHRREQPDLPADHRDEPQFRPLRSHPLAVSDMGGRHFDPRQEPAEHLRLRPDASLRTDAADRSASSRREYPRGGRTRTSSFIPPTLSNRRPSRCASPQDSCTPIRMASCRLTPGSPSDRTSPPRSLDALGHPHPNPSVHRRTSSGRSRPDDNRSRT